MLIIWKLGFWISLLFTCRPTDSEISDKIIDSVEFQESRGVYSVRSNSSCTGLMQVNYRYTPFPRSLLRVPIINRTVGTRMLRNWKKRAGGNIRIALASYNCGNAGLKGICGRGYANSVLLRNIHRKRSNIPECSIMGRAINYYYDNGDYLIKWRTNIWHYLHLPRHQRQRQ